MAQLAYRQLAPDDSVFAPDAFAGTIGQEITVKLDEVPVGTGRVVAVEVAPDGRSAWVTIDADELPRPVLNDLCAGREAGYSFADDGPSGAGRWSPGMEE